MLNKPACCENIQTFTQIDREIWEKMSIKLCAFSNTCDLGQDQNAVFNDPFYHSMFESNLSVTVNKQATMKGSLLSFLDRVT